MGRMKKTFTEQIRRAIRNSGLSQYRIWNECGIDKGHLSKFMSGKAGISLDALDRIADLIGMRVETDTGKVKEHGKCDQ